MTMTISDEFQRPPPLRNAHPVGYYIIGPADKEKKPTRRMRNVSSPQPCPRAICTVLERALNDIRDNFICITRKEVDLSILNQHTVHVINKLL